MPLPAPSWLPDTPTPRPLRGWLVGVSLVLVVGSMVLLSGWLLVRLACAVLAPGGTP